MATTKTDSAGNTIVGRLGGNSARSGGTGSNGIVIVTEYTY